jgi:hypothetical protein
MVKNRFDVIVILQIEVEVVFGAAQKIKLYINTSGCNNYKLMY